MEVSKNELQQINDVSPDDIYRKLQAYEDTGLTPEEIAALQADIWADGWDKAIDTAIEELDDIPAADVRPERHGEWLVSGECYECSGCGGGSTVNTNPYCWKCGAKMDRKDGDSDG